MAMNEAALFSAAESDDADAIRKIVASGGASPLSLTRSRGYTIISDILLKVGAR